MRELLAIQISAVCISGLALAAGCRGSKDDTPAAPGHFEPLSPEVVLLTDGRKPPLLKAFASIEPTTPNNGRRWDVPAGATVDGASIPRLFWSLVSGPWEGE